MDKLNRETLLKHLRHDLGHLYDAYVLRQSPLAALFGVADQFDTASALRCILIDAIESLKPPDDEPSLGRQWRVYDSLFCCYVQRLSQRVAADQLGVSPRQLRREQRAALETLADHLWREFDLQQESADSIPLEPSPARATGASTSILINDELAWLRDAPLDESADLNETLPRVLELVQRLAKHHDVSVTVKKGDALPDLAVHPVALSQTLLSLLGVVIPRTPEGGQARISVRSQGRNVEIQVQGAPHPSGTPSLSDEESDSLELARQLADLSAGGLTLSAEGEPFGATLTLPVLEQLPVLIVDDSADTLQLLQRYIRGTRYRFVSTRDPEQALSLAQQFAPEIIVLDVMMPQVDGWRVLGRLQQHPLTGHIPIVVCTILPQEALALSLGASAYLRKPITRQAFLATLDRQVRSVGKGLR